MKGLEPPRPEAQDPKSCAATNYATSAWKIRAKVQKISLQQGVWGLSSEFEVFAQVDLSYMLIISKLLGGTRFQDSSLEQEVGPVGY